MKKFYPLVLVLFCCPFLGWAQWQSYDPNFPDTIGIAFTDVVDDDVVWATGLRYGVDECIFSPFVADKCFYTRTNDGGATWKTGEIPLGTVPFLANITALDANTAWVAGLDGGGEGSKILKTLDGGTTWEHQTSAAFDPAASWVNFVHFRSPAAGVAMGDPRDGYFEIYQTVNGGDFWTRIPENNIDPPLPGEFGYNGAFDAIGNNYWFATNQGRVYRSTDGGNSWTAHPTTIPDGFFITFSDENNGLLAQITTLDCSTSPPVFQFSVSRTTDGGITWEDATPANNNYAITALKFVKGTSVCVMTVRSSNLSGGFYTWVSQDYGTTWAEVGSGQNVSWIDFVDGDTGWGGEYQMLDNKTAMFRYTGSPLSGLLAPKQPEIEVNLFPNPTDGWIKLSVNSAPTSDILISIIDATGRLVRREAMAQNQHNLNLSGLAEGIYTLTIGGSAGIIAKKIVKR